MHNYSYEHYYAIISLNYLEQLTQSINLVSIALLLVNNISIAMYKTLLKVFSTILILNCYIFISNIASANLLGNFQVSKKTTKVHQRRTIGSGSRSSCVASITTANGIELLVPNLSIAHQTRSPNPSLYLYSRTSQSISITFTLIEPKTPQPLMEKIIPIEKTGITEISLPPDLKLENDRVYMWYVAIPCKNTPQQYQTVLNAGIERVDIHPRIATKLSNSNSNLEKIEIYKANGLWYETIDLVIKNFSEHEIDTFLAHHLFSKHSEVEKDI